LAEVQQALADELVRQLDVAGPFAAPVAPSDLSAA
jgi:hypothetical protein